MTTAQKIALKQHPLSAAFPSMPEQEVEALAIDIEKNGQREKAVMYEGMVLDGWHRYLACEMADLPFHAEEFDGEDPIAFVLSHNLHRRHLTGSQRAAAVVKATSWRGNGHNKSTSAPGAELTAKELAEKAEVSERTIEHAKTAERAGLGDAVREGQVSAKRAAEVAKLPKGKREKALNAPAKPKAKSAPGAELTELQGRYADLLEKNADLADTARELEDKLTAFEKTEPDEQQKEIMKLQKKVVKLEAEVERITRARNDAQAKNNELIREVKRLRKSA